MYSRRINLSATPAQAEVWISRAHQEELTLSQWMRQHLDAAAGVDHASMEADAREKTAATRRQNAAKAREKIDYTQKLSSEQQADVVRRWMEGETQTSIAEDLGVSQFLISLTLKRMGAR